MRTYDLSPLFRSTVGFDGLTRMLDRMQEDTAPSYPPYNIEKIDDDNYRITMAVAGFSEDDLDITVQENTLIISGRLQNRSADDEQSERVFLHRGIAERAFERRFSLADHIKIEDARLENGLLHVSLQREVPEEAKARQIPINGAQRGGQKTIEGKSEKKEKANA